MDSKYQSLSAAVNWTKKKIYPVEGKSQRWLDHDSLIQLTLKQVTSRNAEFYVNDNPDHTIWFSQLTECFIQLEKLTICSGETIKKNGEKMFTRDMDLDTFITFIKGKTFRVSVNPDGTVAKFDGSTLPYGTTLTEAQELIRDLVKKEDYEEAAKFLLPATEYNLTEV